MAKKTAVSKKHKSAKEVDRSIMSQLGMSKSDPTDPIAPSKVLKEIQEQSKHCDDLAAKLVSAVEARKEAQAEYDAAVDRLRALCRPVDMPLYEKKGSDE